MRRSRGRLVLTIVFALLAANALLQVLLALLGRSDDPAALTALQALVGGTGTAAAWGSWSGARWSPFAALAYGIATAALLGVLPALLDLSPDARPGIWTGAAIMLLFGILAARYLRRSTQPGS